MSNKTILCICVGCFVSISLWGQTSGIMPRKSASVKIPAQKTVATNRAVEPQGVAREGNSLPLDTVCRVAVFDSLAGDMLGFDKRMSDTKESFLLRNNTQHRISRVVLKLVYRTPEGQMIDYRTRTVECDLLPHSTRRCEVESFDRSKNYYHVDSPPARVSGRPFKVSFQLLRYDIVVEP